MFWLEEGDSNSKFFHASASTRNKLNHISYLKTEAGEVVDTEQGMYAVVNEYFTNVFASSSDNTQLRQDNEERVITDNRNKLLTADVFFEEFTMAVKQMHPDKASGPDGLNPTFFPTLLDNAR